MQNNGVLNYAEKRARRRRYWVSVLVGWGIVLAVAGCLEVWPVSHFSSWEGWETNGTIWQSLPTLAEAHQKSNLSQLLVFVYLPYGIVVGVTFVMGAVIGAVWVWFGPDWAGKKM